MNIDDENDYQGTKLLHFCGKNDIELIPSLSFVEYIQSSNLIFFLVNILSRFRSTESVTGVFYRERCYIV